MDLQEVLDFFGGSIFAEEYRGNLTLIRNRIDHLQRDAESPGAEGSDLQARVLLLRAVFNLLIGDSIQASKLLFRICDSATYIWQIRSFAYIGLLIGWSRFPPILQYRAEIGGAAGQLSALETGYVKNTQKIADTLQRASNNVTAIQQFERKITLYLSTICMNLRLAIFLHPLYPRTEGQSPPAIESDSSGLVRSLQLEALAINCPEMHRYLGRILLESDIARGAPDLVEKFTSLKTMYSSAQDWAGLASVYLLEGDRILSPPFSNPLSLNLVVTDFCSATIRNTQWDSVEASIWLNDDVNAQNCYARAFENFERARAFRGCAAVQLRRGCIKHANALKTNIDSSEWHEGIHAAELYFAKALDLFDIDTQNLLIVKTHTILLSISAGQGQDLVSRARLIGSTARQCGSPILGQHCGLLMMRFGQRQWLDYSRSSIAFKCYECALGCFSSLQDQYLTLIATTTQLELYTLLSNHTQSRALAEQAIPLFRDLLSCLKTFKDDDTYRKIISGLIHTLVIDFPPHIFRSYFYTHDLNALKRWREEVEIWENDASLELGTRFDGPTVTNFLLSHGHQADSLSTIEHQRRKDNERIYQYYVADIESQAAFQDFDVDKAENILRTLQLQFAGEELTINSNTDIKNRLLSYICHRLGDHEQARLSLDRIPNAIIFNETVRESISSDYAWSSKDAGSYIWSPDSAENALGICVRAQHWAKGERILKRIKSISPRFLDVKGLDREGDMWHRLLFAGLLTEGSNDVDQAFEYLLSSADVAERRRQATAGEDARRASYFTSDSGELFQALARVALCLATFQESPPHESPISKRFSSVGKTWPEQALIFMEQGKARVLLDSILANRSSRDMEDLRSDASWMYKRRLYLDLLSVPAESLSDSESAELKALERDMIKHQDLTPGFEYTDSLLDAATKPQTTLKQHYNTIPSNAAVIEFGFSQQGLIVFCILSSGIHSFGQSRVTFIEARRLVFRYVTEAARQSLDHSADRTRRLKEWSKQLSDVILAPVERGIHDKSHIIFVPSQPALVFPFSALLYNGKPLFLSKAVSQAPSLATLSNLIQKSSTVASPLVSALAKPGTMKAGAKEPPLKMAGIEALTLGYTFGRPPIDVKNMSGEEFRSILSQSDIVHLSTHGHTDSRSPWQAWISLRERFRVVDLTSVSCRASMVFFSACLSGLGKATIGNDVTGFSHSMLSSGALVYLGALWRVDDISTMLLVVLFYRRLAQSTGDVPVAEYWRRAQVSLYQMSIEEVKDLMDDILHGLSAAETAGYEPDKFVKKCKAHLRNARDHVELDPRDPFTWAPFIIVGNGDLKFDMGGAKR